MLYQYRYCFSFHFLNMLLFLFYLQNQIYKYLSIRIILYFNTSMQLITNNYSNLTRIFFGYREPSNLQLTCLKECYIPTPNVFLYQKHLFTKYSNNVIYIVLRLLCYKYKICQIQNSFFFKSLVDGLFFIRFTGTASRRQ